jgi:hypothetical protein
MNIRIVFCLFFSDSGTVNIFRIFDNRVLRKTFGSKKEEVIGDWRRLHNEELHDLYTSQNIRVTNSRKMRWAEHVERRERKRHAYNIFVTKPERKRPLGRPRRRGKDNIKLEKVWNGLIWLRIWVSGGPL